MWWPQCTAVEVTRKLFQPARDFDPHTHLESVPMPEPTLSVTQTINHPPDILKSKHYQTHQTHSSCQEYIIHIYDQQNTGEGHMGELRLLYIQIYTRHSSSPAAQLLQSFHPHWPHPHPPPCWPPCQLPCPPQLLWPDHLQPTNPFNHIAMHWFDADCWVCYFGQDCDHKWDCLQMQQRCKMQKTQCCLTKFAKVAKSAHLYSESDKDLWSQPRVLELRK